MKWLLSLLVLAALVTVTGSQSRAADRQGFLALARTGWNYQLRTTMLGRDMSIPVHINGRDMSGVALCLVGDRPTEQTRKVLATFSDLSRHVFGKPLPMRYAGPRADMCGQGRTAVLRLYSGVPPHHLLTDDLNWMNAAYQLGLPSGRRYSSSSPAMAQTFFGKRGMVTHMLVQQAKARPGSLEETYYRSILIEELFQSFTFGMDILMLRRKPEFSSKLQEVPLNIHRLPWGSAAFMRALLSSNPARLCEFDVFMMHAVARSPVDQTTDPAFIDFIDSEFDTLDALTQVTRADPRFALLLDPDCRAVNQ
ncbi:hypothetical protein [Antarctobacter sp.]|uniref:hypothetical protein n=1 Tax=Antarctobacter sp. TaxID=1872577 RepID=UPI003A94B8FE